MKDIFSKAKDKLFPKPELDFEDDQSSDESEIIDDVEIDASDSSAMDDAKKKNIIIVAVAIVLSIVVYFIIFAEEEAPKESLVQPVGFASGVAKSDISPFQIDAKEEAPKEEIDVLEKPAVPELPEIPKIDEKVVEKEAALFDEDLFEEDEVEKPKAKVKKQAEEGLSEKGVLVSPSSEEKSAERSAPSAVRGDSKKFHDPRYAPIIVLKGDTGQGLPGAGTDDNLKVLGKDAIDDLADSELSVEPTFIKNRENVIAQGKIINAVLETAIDTQIQGTVRAIVSRDVYGEVGSKILISKGSRLYGSYSTETARGNARININWNRMIRPDGVSVAINSIASDQFGRAGIQGIIDNKFQETLSNTILSSALAIAGVAATDALTDNQTSTATTDPTTGTSTVTQSAINQAVTDITTDITTSARQAVQGFFDTTPRISVPQGTRITILVNSDIKIPTFNNK